VVVIAVDSRDVQEQAVKMYLYFRLVFKGTLLLVQLL
jgi:hypothetical protein